MGGEHGDRERRDGAALDSLPRWLRDFIEYNDELAGRETGRRKRILVSGEDEDTRARDKKERRRFDELLRLLQNPVYAQLYRQATETIERLDTAAERAKRKLACEGEIAAEQLNRLKANAAELPDGRKVFRAKDGRLIADDGTDVTARQDSIKGLSPENSGWEAFRDAQNRLEEVQRQQHEIDDYMRDVIDPARERLADAEHPMTEEELREFQHRAEETLPSVLRAEVDDLLMDRAEAKTSPQVNSAADEYVGPAGLDAPDLFAQFSAASSVVAYDPFAASAPDVSTNSEIAQSREPHASQTTSLPASTPDPQKVF